MRTPEPATPDFNQLVTTESLQQFLGRARLPLAMYAQWIRKTHAEANQMLRSPSMRNRIVSSDPHLLKEPGIDEGKAQATSELFVERLATLTQIPLSVPMICRFCDVSEHGYFRELTENTDDPQQVRVAAKQVMVDLLSAPLTMLAETTEEKIRMPFTPRQKVDFMMSLAKRAITYLMSQHPKKFEEMSESEFRWWGLNALLINPSMWEQLQKHFGEGDQSFDPRCHRFAMSGHATEEEMARMSNPMDKMFAGAFVACAETANSIILKTVSDQLRCQPEASLQRVIAQVAQQIDEGCEESERIMKIVAGMDERGTEAHLEEIERALSTHQAPDRVPNERTKEEFEGIARTARALCMSIRAELTATHSAHVKFVLLLIEGALKKSEISSRKALL